MTHDEYIKRRDEIVRKVDSLKTKENPDGNPFLPGNLSYDEAQQAIDELVEAVLGKPIGRQEAYALTQNDKASKLFVQASQLTVDTQRYIVKGGE